MAHTSSPSTTWQPDRSHPECPQGYEFYGNLTDEQYRAYQNPHKVRGTIALGIDGKELPASEGRRPVFIPL